jgi:4-amino-4-deoxy-L-arabinose transferase-like glycosyltransferase
VNLLAEKKAAGSWLWIDLLLLTTLAGILAGLFANRPQLVDPDEARSALVARLMVERGDWLSPHLPVVMHHELSAYPIEDGLSCYWDKPPLYFWLVALAMKVLGPTALAARLPSVLGLVAAALLLYAAGRRMWNRRVGLIAGMALAVALLPLAMSHVARMESLLMALMTAMLLASLRLLNDRPRSWFWVAVLYLCGGLGVLTKGPIAVVLPAGAIGLTLLVCGRLRDWRCLRPFAGLVIVALVAAPWFIYMHLRYPSSADGLIAGFSHVFFVSQNLERAVTAKYGHGSFPGAMVLATLGGLLPWTIFLPGACQRLWPTMWRERRQRPAFILPLAWALVIVAAFSISKTQMFHYILPAVPPLLLFVAVYLAELTLNRQRDPWFVLGQWLVTFMGLAALVGLIGYMCHQGTWRSDYPTYPAVIAIVLGFGALATWRRWRTVFLVVIPVWMILFVAFIQKSDTFEVYDTRSTYRESQILKKWLRPEDHVVSYPRPSYSFIWYMWPRDLSIPGPDGRPLESPTPQDFMDDLKKFPRSFCLLEGRTTADFLADLQRWKVTTKWHDSRHTLVLIEPPADRQSPGP